MAPRRSLTRAQALAWYRHWPAVDKAAVGRHLDRVGATRFSATDTEITGWNAGGRVVVTIFADRIHLAEGYRTDECNEVGDILLTARGVPSAPKVSEPRKPAPRRQVTKPSSTAKEAICDKHFIAYPVAVGCPDCM